MIRFEGLVGGGDTIESFAKSHADAIDAGEQIRIGAQGEDGRFKHLHSLFHETAVPKLILLAQTPSALALQAKIMRLPMPPTVHELGEARGLEVAPEVFEATGQNARMRRPQEHSCSSYPIACWINPTNQALINRDPQIHTPF